mmetsp:Transcript_71039/g.126456  ORF Transcript_71039/g.126456 Transcript_71039/m.126456 type:complete len:466 (-) Transcript_71039:59-1456(-)
MLQAAAEAAEVAKQPNSEATCSALPSQDAEDLSSLQKATLTIFEVCREFPRCCYADHELDLLDSPAVLLKLRVRMHSPKRFKTSGGKTAGPKPGEIPLEVFSLKRSVKLPEEVLARASSPPASGELWLRQRAEWQVPGEERAFITSESVVNCLEVALHAQRAPVGSLPMAAKTWMQALRIFASAKLLGFERVVTEALAWEDFELIRLCYWQILQGLAQRRADRGPAAFGVMGSEFVFETRRWPLKLFSPIVEAGCSRLRLAQAPPVDGFAVCRVLRVGNELCLFQEVTASKEKQLLRAELGSSQAVLYIASEGASELPPGALRQWSEDCCGVLEVDHLGHRFQLREGVDLLPGKFGKKFADIRERFPHMPSALLATASWELDLLSASSGEGRWHLSLDAQELPPLRSLAAKDGTGRLELQPPDGGKDTPWIVLGELVGPERMLMWRHPVGSAAALATAAAAVYPW